MKRSKPSGNLFTSFAPVPKEKWKEQAIDDLKGADYEQKLVWHTYDHFDVEPYYTRRENQSLKYLRNSLRGAHNRPGVQEARYWFNIPKITEADPGLAMKAAMAALENGADGIYFDFADADTIDLISLARQMRPLKCYSVYRAGHKTVYQLSQQLLEGGTASPLEAATQGGINFDPIQQFTLTGTWNDGAIPLLKDLGKALKPFPQFRALTINSTHLHDSGATASQELGYLLNTMVDYMDLLTEQGMSVEDIMSTLRFEVAIGTSYFMEIAKLKALRILCARILEQYTASPVPADGILIHSMSSLWSKTIFDPYVNMLRNTTEAMSAITGGCDVLTLTPHDTRYLQNADFSRRITKNIPIILKEESYFDKTADPAAGSYYVEQLVDKLIQQALGIFAETEKQGGFLESFRKGIVQKALEASRKERNRDLATRKAVFVGSNKYPNTGEQVDPDSVKAPGGTEYNRNTPELLRPGSGAEKIEALRLKTERWIKGSPGRKRPRVFLSLMGQNATMRSARATFSANFLGCAGFDIVEGPIAEDTETALTHAVNTAADITVLCGADDDYEAHALEYAVKFKNAPHSGLLLLAGNPGGSEQDLIQAGFDGFIHVRTNLIEALDTIQQKLDIK